MSGAPMAGRCREASDDPSHTQVLQRKSSDETAAIELCIHRAGGRRLVRSCFLSRQSGGRTTANRSGAAAKSARDESAGGSAGERDKPYTVICQNTVQGTRTCKVDRGTYQGWRTYHAFCYQCHAQDAVGSSFAPSLVERMKQIDKQRFVHSVTNGYKGQIGVMPA
ncbi:MAG: cytochrome c, partial [Dysgonamonadaceae bacterium]